ncbi:hypothetical protein [Verrucomicrobium sp. GAS474]|uniref:hypothetical protein n=1 Tax=Verrucomicrobium sp. GAS474 TaxID=1882831 RepID=UPI0012FFC66F|nr:hypothetical protein [Verrucomicrobium sp. GAS474]
MIVTLPPDKRNNLALLTMSVMRTIRGGLATRRRPYIAFMGVRYSNQVLAQVPTLAGKKLKIYVNRSDLRTLKAFYEDGAEFGQLVANGGWALQAHDLATRQAINSLRHLKTLRHLETADPVAAYLDFLNAQAAKSKRARTKIVDVEKRASAGEPIKDSSETWFESVKSEPPPTPFREGVLDDLSLGTITY